MLRRYVEDITLRALLLLAITRRRCDIVTRVIIYA